MPWLGLWNKDERDHCIVRYSKALLGAVASNQNQEAALCALNPCHTGECTLRRGDSAHAPLSVDDLLQARSEPYRLQHALLRGFREGGMQP